MKNKLQAKVKKLNKELKKAIFKVVKENGFIKPPVISLVLSTTNSKHYKDGTAIGAGFLRASTKSKFIDTAQIKGVIENIEDNICYLANAGMEVAVKEDAKPNKKEEKLNKIRGLIKELLESEHKV